MRTHFLLVALVCAVTYGETSSASDGIKAKLHQQHLLQRPLDEVRHHHLVMAKRNAMKQLERPELFEHAERAIRQAAPVGSKIRVRREADPEFPPFPCPSFQECVRMIHQQRLDNDRLKRKLAAPPRRCPTCENDIPWRHILPVMGLLFAALAVGYVIFRK